MNRVCKEVPDGLLKFTSGCGSSFWLAYLFRIPRWFSEDFWCACNCHDISFSDKIKSSMIDKMRADDKLYDDMYYVAFHTENKFKRWLMFIIADITYWCLSTSLSDLCWLSAKK